VVWVADTPDWERHTEWCVDYCARKGYVLVAVVQERLGGRYDDGARMMFMDGKADLIVVADYAHLPVDRLPRVELVAQERRRMMPRPAPRFLR
jgi:hypothetical protein